MKELKLKEPIEMSLDQFQCPNCQRKFYINEEDKKEFPNDIDCPFCAVTGVPKIRLFKISINQIFEE